MKLMKSSRIKIYFLALAFIASLAGNTYACLFPFSAQIEKMPMPCDTPELSSPGSTPQTDDNCNKALLDEGKISHINSYAQQTSLRAGLAASSLSLLVSQALLAPQAPSFHFIHQRRLADAKYLSVPIYTSNHTYLI